MTLFKYLTRDELCSLPNPAGPLVAKMPSSLFRLPMTWSSLGTLPPAAVTPCGRFKHYTVEEKARIGKRAAECGITSEHSKCLWHVHTIDNSFVKYTVFGMVIQGNIVPQKFCYTVLIPEGKCLKSWICIFDSYIPLSARL